MFKGIHYFYYEMHPLVQDILCKVIAHLQCWIQLKVFLCQLLMNMDRYQCLVKLVRVDKMFPEDSFPCYCQASWLPCFITLFNIVPYFFLKLCCKKKKFHSTVSQCTCTLVSNKYYTVLYTSIIILLQEHFHRLQL